MRGASEVDSNRIYALHVIDCVSKKGSSCIHILLEWQDHYIILQEIYDYTRTKKLCSKLL